MLEDLSRGTGPIEAPSQRDARHYILFPDVGNARTLYDRMKAEGLRCTFAPTPREADRCCGLAVLYEDAEDRAEIERMIEEGSVQILRFFEAGPVDPARLKFS